MTIRHQMEVEVLPLLFAGALGVFFAFYTNHKLQNKIVVPIPATVEIAPTPTPKPQIASQISPDGTKRLTMTATNNKDLSKNYTFSVSDENGDNEQTIYTVSNTKDLITIPFNTWSPDNKYVFVASETSLGKDAIVIKANGEPITNTEAAINVVPVFKDKITNNFYDETTGWASETLLIINSKTSEDKKSTSYWFEVPSKAVIPLSTEF